jgi:hypothetical protein
MSDPKNAPEVDPPKQKPPESAGAIDPPTAGSARRPPTTQAQLIKQQTEELEEWRRRADAEVHAWRLRCEQGTQRELELTAAKVSLETTNGHLLRELQSNGFALIVAGALATMGSALLSYLTSDASKLAALVVAAAGCFWGLAQGVMTFVKNDRDAVAARRAALVLFIVIIILLCIHWRDIAGLALRLI